MLTSSATIQTQNPQQIMNRLCKHWAHKLPVTLSSDKGEIELPMGVCQMYCTDLLKVHSKVMPSSCQNYSKLSVIICYVWLAKRRLLSNGLN